MEGLQEHTVTPRAAGNTGQRSVKQEGGHWKQGRLHPHEPEEWQGEGHHPDQTRTVKSESEETPFCYWNQDALSRWLGPENLGWALVEGVQTRVLLDNGTLIPSLCLMSTDTS